MNTRATFKLLKFPAQNIHTERLKSVLQVLGNAEYANEEFEAIDGVLVALENHLDTIDHELAPVAVSDIVKLRSLIEVIYESYFE